METNIKTIKNVLDNAEQIFRGIERLEKGFRAISVAYDEHSDDKHSFKNIGHLQSNITYRLYSAREQYMIYIGGIKRAEQEILEMHKQNKEKGIQIGSQSYTEFINELNLSSYFDNILFNICSSFDYLSHIVSYVLYKNKDRTFDWDKLIKKLHSDDRFQKLEISNDLEKVNRSFVFKLQKYRSRLIHTTRDKHQLHYKIDDKMENCQLLLITSKTTINHLKSILVDKNSSETIDEYCLNYTISKIVYETLYNMEFLLDSMYNMIVVNSDWPNTLQIKKNFYIVNLNPKNGKSEPVSKKLWNEFKKIV
ncbi:hypothetical protein [Arenibacter sp. S6351L]|uniref:hypothetical protein n=1 Tax=Arenibacter sp. S6351L TaxID=2926407 RepID=UPI001FF1D9D2|nr:hypothetical protein [Arenibacter sp. S6351L]MCK0133217.1 hypothetical protein [Arenibacter sp. S6351L]